MARTLYGQLLRCEWMTTGEPLTESFRDARSGKLRCGAESTLRPLTGGVCTVARHW